MGQAPSRWKRADEATWAKKHELGIDKTLKTRQRDMVRELLEARRLKLVCSSVNLNGCEYIHYGITNGSLLIEFGNGQMDPQQLQVYAVGAMPDKVEVKEFEVTAEVRNRTYQVLGATNYSIFLRNSEHLARFIQCGTWCSTQMTSGNPAFQAVSGALGDNEKLLNTLPEDLQVHSQGSLEAIYRDWQHPFQVVFEQEQVLFDPEDSAFNVALLGPTGAGKSTIINLLFNKRVALVKASPQSVTRHMSVYSGTFTGRAGTKKLNVLDTIGFCDSVLPAGTILSLVKQYVKSQVAALDKVIVVTSGRIEAEHATAIRNFMEWLRYHRHKTEFLFVYNKAEDMSEQEKTEAVGIMCDSLGADARFSVIVTVPGSAMEQDIPCAFATGFPRRAQLSDVSVDLNLLNTAVFRLRSDAKRIKVDQSRCAIL